MTPHEHYLEAERVIRELDAQHRTTGVTNASAGTTLLGALVHAVLATAPRPPRLRGPWSDEELRAGAAGTTDDPLDRDK